MFAGSEKGAERIAVIYSLWPWAMQSLRTREIKEWKQRAPEWGRVSHFAGAKNVYPAVAPDGAKRIN